MGSDMVDQINNRVTRSDLLLAGWHSIYEGDIDREYWVHPKVVGGHELKVARKIQKILAKNIFENQVYIHGNPTR